LFLAFLAACTPTDLVGDPPCARTVVGTDVESPPVAEADVWPVVAAFSPNRVSWTRAPDGAVQDTFTWTLTRTGDAQVVSYTANPGYGGACEERVGLVLPVAMTVDIGGGKVTQTTERLIEATGPSLAEIVLYETGSLTEDLHATVDDDWFSQCLDSEEWRGALTDVWLIVGGPLDALEADVEAGLESTDTRTVGICWSGWVTEAGDTGG
jgi:hypothetical protein